MAAAAHQSPEVNRPARLSRRRLVAWLLGYVAVAVVAAVWLNSARTSAIENLSGEAAIGQWQQFNQEMAEEQRRGSPVTRKLSPSDEPPSLVLLRDHFGGILISLLVILAFLYAFVAFLIEGIVRSKSTPGPGN